MQLKEVVLIDSVGLTPPRPFLVMEALDTTLFLASPVSNSESPLTSLRTLA